MIGSIVRQQIARTNRNLLISNAVLLALILLYAAVTTVVTGQNQFFLTLGSHSSPQHAEEIAPADMSHPTEITVQDLASDARLKQLQGHAVRLTDRQSVDVAFPVWNSPQRGASDNPSLQPKYRLSQRGERLVLILPPDSTTTGPVFTGVVRPLDEQDSNIVTTVLHSRGIRNFTMAPLMLDGLSHRARSGRLPAGLALPPLPIPNMFLLLLGAVPVWNVCKAIQRGKRPETHPLVRSLEKYGSVADLSRAIDADCAAGITRITPAQFTARWLLVPTFYTCIAVPLDAIVWIYERVYVARSVSFAVCLRDWQGSYVEFTCGFFQVQKILDYTTRFRPWIVSGYSGQRAADFASNRAQFLAEVDRHRRQYPPASAPTPPNAPHSP